MKTLYILVLFFGITTRLFAQNPMQNNPYQQEMNLAYQQYPNVPRGMLEAVSYKMTRFAHLDNNTPESCLELPRVYTVMGLTENGKGYFRSNLQRVAQLSGFSVAQIKSSPQISILAYAAAYSQLLQNMGIAPNDINEHDRIIAELSEIPLDHDPVNQFAMDARLFDIFRNFKNSSAPLAPAVNLETIFGVNNLKVLSSTNIDILDAGVTANNVRYNAQFRTSEYGPAIWNPTPSCNYSSRGGTAISAVVIHTTQGTYGGAISWAKNCSSNISFHYIVRSSDGQITQMLLEAKKGWHARTANPYTIGIEHEGYVNNPSSWYTNAMYNSSAALVRDITQSGYGILPTRTYFGPGTTGTSVTLGSCVKIKGHQHYPAQSHNDPGPGWNWKKYYLLINNATTPTTTTAATGNYYDTGGANGNYSNDERTLYLIQPTGASTVTINFQSFDLENNWDYMFVYDGATTSAPLLATLTGSTLPAPITSTGGSLLIEFRSDCATPMAGWALSWTSNGSGGNGNGNGGNGNGNGTDVIPPTSTVSTPNTWGTADFTASFTDADNTGGSGLKERYYQVIYYNGTEWRANDGNGFFKDNFDAAINGDWAQQVGTWSINSNHLEQTDETQSNSNLYALLDQNTHNRYLYNWTARIEGSGTNRRAGLHFMSDDGSFTNRKNSYFVYFRADNNKVQIYEVTNDVFALVHEVPFTINANQWYDWKITYDKTTGKISVWIDDNYVTDWTDATPITSGDYISLRGGNCRYLVDNFNIYHDRTATETITVGAGVTNDLRFQNPSPNIFAGKIKSIVIDNQNNISAIGAKNINVDWTAPSDVTSLNDGTAADINTTASNTQLAANWSASADPHSSVVRYWYAVGTSPGATDVLGWTDNWFNTDVTISGLNLTVGTTYYISVKAEDGAGLLSNIVSTDGQTVVSPTGAPVADFILQNTFVCAGDSIQVQNNSQNATSYQWTANGGAVINNPTAVNPYVTFSNSGSYTITLTANGTGGTDINNQTLTVVVSTPPIANAVPTDSIVCVNDPFVSFNNTSQNADSYIWSFGDGGVSTDESPWHSFPAPGVYTVVLTAISNNCPNATKQINITVDACAGVEEVDNFALVLFPNPVNEAFTMVYRLSETEQMNVSLFDLTGRKVATVFAGNQNAGNHTLQFNVKDAGVAKGVYQLTLETAQSRVVKTIIVK